MEKLHHLLVISTICIMVTVNSVTMVAVPVIINNLAYELDEQNKTAEVVYDLSTYHYKKDFDIPTSVLHQGQIYDVTSIGDWAFKGLTYMESVTIPNSVVEIKYCAFKSCPGLDSVIIPNSVTTIGNEAFSQCKGLRSIVLPESLKIINYRMFFNCWNVQHFYLPASIDSIGSNAFLFCRMTEFTCHAATPPALGDNVFGGQANKAFLYVPAVSVELYKAADQWKEFKFIKAIETTDIYSSQLDHAPCSKRLQDGQIVIDLSDKTYTIDGIRIR